MGGVSDYRVCEYLEEGVDIEDLGPETVTDEVMKLDRPWIGDEGPLDADFWQLESEELPRHLHYRGLAFDTETTVQWDEDLVQVIRPMKAEVDVIARKSEVLIHERFLGLASVFRVDYLRHGVLLASRYMPGRSRKEVGDA